MQAWGIKIQNDVRLVSYNFIGGWIVDQFPLHEFLRLCYHMRFNGEAAQYIQGVSRIVSKFWMALKI